MTETESKRWQFLFTRRWWLPGWGEISLSALWIALISGIILIPAYHIDSEPFKAISRFTTADSVGYFLHALHSYAGDLFLIALFMHTLEYLLKKTYRAYRPVSWLLLVLLLIGSVLTVFSGFLSLGSQESLSAMHIFKGILAELGSIGTTLNHFLTSQRADTRGLLTIFSHHVATFTVLTIILTYVHLRRLKSEWHASVFTFTLLVVTALFLKPAIGLPPDSPVEVVKGPWYFLGLQEALSWLPVWLAGIVLPALFIGLLGLLPLCWKYDRSIFVALTLLFLFYLAETFISALLRGPGWQMLSR